MDVPDDVLRDMMNERAREGKMFTVGQAKIDMQVMPDLSERTRAERWRWSRRQVRNLLETGTADPRPPGTTPDQSGPLADQKAPQTAQKRKQRDQSGPLADQAEPESIPISNYTPPSPYGGLPPQGGRAIGIPPEKPPTNAEVVRAEVDRLARQAVEAADERKRLERERKRLKRAEEAEAFQPPTPDDVRRYANAKGFPPGHADEFVDYWTARDWKMKGGVKMKDWKSGYRTWLRNAEKFGSVRKPQTKLNLSTPIPERLMPRALAEYPSLSREDFFRNGRDQMSGEPAWMVRPEALAEVKSDA